MDSSIFNFRLQHELTTNELTSQKEFKDYIREKVFDIQNLHSKCTLSKYLALTKYLQHVSLCNSLVIEHPFMEELLKPVHSAIYYANLEVEIVHDYKTNMEKEQAMKTFFYSVLKKHVLDEDMPDYQVIDNHLGKFLIDRQKFNFEFNAMVREYMDSSDIFYFYKSGQLIECHAIELTMLRGEYFHSYYQWKNDSLTKKSNEFKNTLQKLTKPIFNESEETSTICQLSDVLNLPFIFNGNQKIENSDIKALFDYLSRKLTNQEYRDTSTIPDLDLLSIGRENVGSIALICLFKSINSIKEYNNNAELSRVMANTFKIDYCEKKRADYLGNDFDELKMIKLKKIFSSTPELYKKIIDFKNNFNSDHPILHNFKEYFISKLVG
jgi:hypothetical protein